MRKASRRSLNLELFVWCPRWKHEKYMRLCSQSNIDQTCNLRKQKFLTTEQLKPQRDVATARQLVLVTEISHKLRESAFRTPHSAS